MTGPSLAELQRLFWRAIAEASGDAAFEPALLACIEPRPAQTAAERVQVYAEMYLYRLRDALREDFPRTAALLGATRFERLVASYLRVHPSTHGSARHLGRHFARFLIGEPDVAPYLADLARLEWARVEVFDAPDVRPLGAADLRRIPPEEWPDLRFSTIPALAVVASAWPIHTLWRDDPPAAVGPEPTSLRVWRTPEGTVAHAPLDARADAALDLVRSGATFAEVCGTFADLPGDEAPREATGLLARWVEDGILAPPAR